MADTKISALPAATVVNSADEFPVIQSGSSKMSTFSVLRTSIGEGLSNASASSVAAGYATDTYLAGSAITIPVAGGWAVGSILRWQFDMTKTAAGTATPVIALRIGTNGTTGDPSIIAFTFAAGTAAADTGIFDVTCSFRTVGAANAAVVTGMVRCTHHLAATGLTSTGASGIGIIMANSAGFTSTTQTVIGLSFNGGASFSGTCNQVIADADKL